MEAIQPLNHGADSSFAVADVDSGQHVPQRMRIRIGELGLLFASDGGREVISPPAISRIPNTVFWLSGVANIRGALVPVVDAAAAFGITRDATAPTYLLIFGHGDTAMGMLIDGLPRLLDVDDSEQLADVPEVPALLDGSVKGVYYHANRIWMDVNVQLLFDSLGRHIAL